MRRTGHQLPAVVLLLAIAAPTTAADPDDSVTDRVAWRYTQKDLTVTFVYNEGSQWIADRTDGERPAYDEIARTGEYVELQNRDSKLFIRLHSDRAYWRRPKDAQWTRWVSGAWVTKPVQSAEDQQPHDYRIRLAYFVPRDRQPVPDYDRKIRLLVSIISELYKTDLQNKGHDTEGIRFEEADGQPVVHLVHGDQPASHYNNAPKYDANEQWRRVVPAIRDALGDHRQRVTIVFSETWDDGPAEHLWPGALARGAYYSAVGGLALYSSHLLRDEFCKTTLDEQRELFFDRTPVRGRRAWGHRMNSPRCEFVEDGIGAVAHELGHALGLPHDRRQDDRYIMGNGFRNLRRNFSGPRDEHATFSDENARLLMSSRYIARDLDLSDPEPPKVDIHQLAGGRTAQTVTLTATDNVGLRSIVFYDREAGSIAAGRQLTGKTQDLRQRLTLKPDPQGAVQLLVIVTDNGGHQTRTPWLPKRPR